MKKKLLHVNSRPQKRVIAKLKTNGEDYLYLKNRKGKVKK